MQHHWRYHKIVSLKQVKQSAAQLRSAGKKIVTVNGSFDLLHAGHLDMLEEAKQQGDVLIVGINSDASIKEKKGAARPIIGQAERAAMLAALACVDYVVIIDAPYDKVPSRLIEVVKPDIHANGAEYGQPATWVEWPAMQAVGAQGHAVARRPGLATSELLQKIKAS